MYVNNVYWFFEKAFTKNFCDDIIKAGFDKNPKLGITGEYEGKKLTNKSKKDLKKVRDSSIAFLDDPWIYNEIRNVIQAANHNAGWKYNYEHYESVQFTVYKQGQHYDWHQDGKAQPYGEESHPNYRGLIRKLSMTIALNDSSEYKGGDFLFDMSNPRQKNRIIKVKELKHKGSAVIFPSFMFHKVAPVTKGTRYSLVVWVLGKPWA